MPCPVLKLSPPFEGIPILLRQLHSLLMPVILSLARLTIPFEYGIHILASSLAHHCMDMGLGLFLSHSLLMGPGFSPGHLEQFVSGMLRQVPRSSLHEEGTVTRWKQLRS